MKVALRGIRPLAWVSGAAASVILGCAAARPEMQAFIENSGVNIPTNDVVRDYASGLLWACVLLLFVLTWPVSWAHKKMLGAAWLVKCFVALVVMLPYERQYWGLDCWTYFQRAHIGLAELVPRMIRGGADLVVGLGALHLKVGPDSYQAMKLSFALIGLLAVYLFFRAWEVLSGHVSPLAFWVLLLYPSVLFWSTIFGKDPLILAAISLYVWGIVNVALRGKNHYLAAVLGGICAASVVRIWMGPILILPCLLILGMRVKSVFWRFAAVALTGLTLAIVAPATADRLQLDKAGDLLEATRTVNDGWHANSSLQGGAELHSVWDLLLSTPERMFIAFFRPLPGDVPNLFGLLAGCENLGLLFLSAWALFRIRFAHFRNHLFLWAVILVTTWGLAYSVVAYKDLGTAVRFKLQIIPILLGMIGFLLRQPALHMAPQRSVRLSRRLALS